MFGGAHITKLQFVLVSVCLLASACGGEKSETPDSGPGHPVVVYAAGNAETMQTVADAYSAESGISIRLTTESGRALVDRISAEKHRSTADLFISDAIAHLWTAAERDVLRPSNSDLLRKNVPANLRDQEDLWFGLRAIARTIAYDKRTIDPADLTGYTDLADPKWHGQLCLSPAAHAANRSQIAMMIAEHGGRPTEMIVRSWIKNLAIPIVADDAGLLQEIDDGRCGLAIVNSDQAEAYARKNPDTSVAMFWPAKAAGGTYIDIVGAAVTRHAGNPAGARRLLEWLSTAEGEKLIGGANAEYQASPVNLARAGYYHDEAVSLMERAHWWQ